jgi:hypothetical protein
MPTPTVGRLGPYEEALMGQRGPAPLPAKLRILKGETRPSQLKRAPESEGPPDLPDDLAPDAKKVWDRLLLHSDHIGPRHAETFRQYCETTAAANAMKPKGTKEWRELVNIHRQLARELCLTPATGAHLTRAKAPERKLDRYTKAG